MVRKTDEEAARNVGLPPTPFLYTIDQICSLVAVHQDIAMRTMFYFANRSSGPRTPRLMIAVNISNDEDRPEWRIAQNEFVRWLRFKGFRISTDVRVIQ